MPTTSLDPAGPLPECRGDCVSLVPAAADSVSPVPTGAGRVSSVSAGTGTAASIPGGTNEVSPVPTGGQSTPVPGEPDRATPIRSSEHGLSGAETGLAGPAPPPNVADHDVIAANCDSRSPDAGLRLQASNNPLSINALRPIGDLAGSFRGRPSPNPSHSATSAGVPAVVLPMCIEFHWKQCVMQGSGFLARALQAMTPSNRRPHPSGWTGGTDGQTRADGTRVEPNDAFFAPEPAFSHASCGDDGSGTGRRAGSRRGEDASAAGRTAARRAMRHRAPGGFGSRHSRTGGTRGAPASPAGTAPAGPRRLRSAPLRPDSGGPGGRRSAGRRRGLSRARAAQATARPGAGTDFRHGHGRQPTPWAVPTHRGLGPHPGHRPTP